ncbi:MAG: type IV pilus modification protein PilV, partial [Gammaproteobacteria bacterium]
MNTFQPNLMTARGFSLLEVLIAILILSIGLLGLASLQSNGMRFNHTSYLRSQATVLSYGIADTMRANRSASLNGDYDTDFTENAATFTGSGLAQTDLNTWKTQLETLLPGGEGLIS